MKKFLDRNEIYFRTAGGLAISGIALIIAIGSLYISCETKNIFNRQADIDETINRPFIVYETETYNYNNNSNQLVTIINFVNTGEYFCNLSAQLYSCICIQGSYEEGQKSNTVYIPISPYYVMTETSLGGKGTILAHLEPYPNGDVVFHKLGDEIENQLGEIGHGVTYLSPNMITVVRLEYASVFGKSYTEYWLIDKPSPHSDDIHVNKLDEDSYIKAIHEYSPPEIPILGESIYSLDSLDASTIIDYWTPKTTFNTSNTQATNNQGGNCASDCFNSYIGDGECDPECFYSTCGWDYQDCGNLSRCAEGCMPNWLGDGFCDRECYSAACNWDGGDCEANTQSSYCSIGCKPNWLGDNFCDASCFNYACEWDDWDCNVSIGCATGCPPQLLGDGWCNSECYSAACSWDGGDCANTYSE